MPYFLQQALENNGYQLSEDTRDQMITYLRLLEQWNKVFNLTAIRDPKEAVYLHILDSLAIHTYLQGSRILDVGTGAGLPGLPLALMLPSKHFTLLDSNNKKTRFLTQVVAELAIKNVTIVHSRCEDFHPEEGFDTIVSRAFASIKVMLTSTNHLIHKQGQFLAMKGIYPYQEMAEIPEDFKVTAVHKIQIKGLDVERCVVCLNKT